ncbi:PepSY domain-containing protein [Streptomyces sp. HU2014]|uniref:Propeptide PepSY amd peptidase M4 n=1 Tax=Streptomyces albireticuli TaxID=1940 RepID=A0A1Z2LBZ2_9ACTN|nr:MULTISPECIES: PepSY domain-containing protein [Streptomyces]ARZ71817.1 propeptide PepSY amd peptidase M4 [Streptomyces albireticuli]UQI45241.1 PepSY domain-containing protein [Streptomyces sp. HU2014]
MNPQLKRVLTGRRRTLAAVLAATLLLGGAGAATAAALTEDGRGDTPVVSSIRADERHDDDHDDDRAEHLALLKNAKVDVRQATDAALKSVPGTVVSAELDDDHGRAAWEVEIVDGKGTEHDVTVDAADGKVTADTDDDQDD